MVRPHTHCSGGCVQCRSINSSLLPEKGRPHLPRVPTHTHTSTYEHYTPPSPETSGSGKTHFRRGAVFHMDTITRPVVFQRVAKNRLHQYCCTVKLPHKSTALLADGFSATSFPTPSAYTSVTYIDFSHIRSRRADFCVRIVCFRFLTVSFVCT